MTVRGVLAGLFAATVLAGCSDAPAASGGTPSVAPSETPVVTPTEQALPPLPKPSKPWPTPKVTGAPAQDAPLADRIRFAIARQAQLAAGKAATTKVSCPELDSVEKAGGEHKLSCTVTYAGASYTGTLTVDAKRYTASYRFTSDSVPIVRAKVVDAVQRMAAGAAKVSCAMEEVAVVKHSDPDGIGCDVTTVQNQVAKYSVAVSGDGKVYPEPT
jgi:hypothetical protein